MSTLRHRPARGLLAMAGAALSGAALAGIWATAIEPRLLDEKRLTCVLPDLPAAWDGEQVVLLADLQVGIRLGNTDTVRRAISRAVALRPALLLFAGDFVYDAVRHSDRILATLAAALEPLVGAGVAMYAVLGNHDYGEEGTQSERLRLAQAVRTTLDGLGIRVLQNESASIAPPGGTGDPLFVVGVGPHIPGRDDPLRALQQVPDGCARLVLMHNPTSFPRLPAGSAPLALAGHTHGGQLRVPFMPSWTLGRLTVPWPDYLDGWLDGYGQPGNRLYVNRGIGFSRYPMRFGCPPELTVLTLQSRRGDSNP